MEDYQAWAQRLLDVCPELSDEWEQRRDLFETEDIREIGIYVFFGDVFVAPAAHLLGDRSNADRALPDPGTDQAEDLLRRMYQVIEDWLGDDHTGTDHELRNLIAVELLESGYGGLAQKQLVRYAGPRLRSLDEEFQAQQQTPEARQRAEHYQQWLRHKYGGVGCPACGSHYIGTSTSRRLGSREVFENFCLTCKHRWKVKQRRPAD